MIIYNIVSNPIFILLVLSFVITIAMYIFVGRKKIKTKNKKVEKVFLKDENKIESNKDSKSDISDEDDEVIKKTSEKFDLVEDNEKIDEKKSNEKKVSRVYVRKPQQITTKSQQTNDELKYEEMSQKAEFVKTTKNISKLTSFNKKEELQDEINVSNVQKVEDCDTCKEIASRINHTARLSKSIKDNNFDDLFRNHISEHYMNINADKRISETILNKLFERTNQLFENSEQKGFTDNFDSDLKNDKEKLRFLLNSANTENVDVDSSVYEEDTGYNLNLKNILISDAVMKRKGKK